MQYIIFTETYIGMAIFFVLPQGTPSVDNARNLTSHTVCDPATLNTMLAMLNARREMRKILPAKSNKLGRVNISPGDAQ